MQASLRSQVASSSVQSATKQTRSVYICKDVFAPAKPTSAKATRDVKAFSKGMRGKAGFPGQMESVKRDIPTPDIDPENAEFVIFVRSTRYPEGKLEIPESQWLPLSIVKGGQAANALVKTCETVWGAKLFSNTLIRNISLAVYKDREMMEERLKETPQFSKVPKGKFEFAFKIRDKANPKDWVKTENITICPPGDVLDAETPQNAISKFFSGDNISSMFA